MVNVAQMKCACNSCLCIVSPNNEVVQKNGKYYCSEACAENHPNGENCGHTGCDCG